MIPREHLGRKKPLPPSQFCPSIPSDMSWNENLELQPWKEIKLENYRIPIPQ